MRACPPATFCLAAANVTDLPPARRGTAMMFQSYALFPHLSVIDNVAFSQKMKGVDKPERLKKAHQLLELVDMDAYAERLPSQLSGGQQQRVALARALITEPPCCCSTSRCRRSTRSCGSSMRLELKRLQRELGISFIHVTHSQDEALALADDIIVMNGGRIEQAGSPRAVFNAPRTEFVARFIGGHNVIKRSRQGSPSAADRLRAKATGGRGRRAAPARCGRRISRHHRQCGARTPGRCEAEITAALPDARFFQRIRSRSARPSS